jgi:hypothetical protein
MPNNPTFTTYPLISLKHNIHNKNGEEGKCFCHHADNRTHEKIDSTHLQIGSKELKTEIICNCKLSTISCS